MTENPTVAQRRAAQEAAARVHRQRVAQVAESFRKLPASTTADDLEQQIIEFFNGAQHRPSHPMGMTLSTLEAISMRIAELSRMALAGSLVQEEGAWALVDGDLDRARCPHCHQPRVVVGHAEVGGPLYRCGCTVAEVPVTPPEPPRIQVDYNGASDGRVLGQSSVSVGTRVLTFDGEGIECEGVVDEVRDNGLVFVKLDWSTWSPEQGVTPPEPSEAEALEKATTLAELYGEGIIQIAGILSDTAAPEAARIRQARTVIASLESGAARRAASSGTEEG